MADITKRITKDGTTSYRVRIRLKGFPIQTATFTTKSRAKLWAQQTEAAMREGRHFKYAESKKHTLGDLIDRYIREVLPKKPKSQNKQTAQLNWWKQQLGKYLLADITPARIVECRTALETGQTCRGRQRSPATVVRYLAALSHAFTIAVKEWGWLDDTPMRKISKPKEPPGRVRYLTDEERQRLLPICRETKHPYLYTVVILALSTGMRHGEIMNLTWKDVDFQRQKIILHDTKNGEKRVVPLLGHALELIFELHDRRRMDSYLLFPGCNPQKPADLRTRWESALKKASIENFTFHDLRHSAASYLAMGKATPGELAAVLGHKTLAMVKRYAYFSDPHTANIVGQMNETIFGDIVNNQPIVERA